MTILILNTLFHRPNLLDTHSLTFVQFRQLILKKILNWFPIPSPRFPFLSSLLSPWIPTPFPMVSYSPLFSVSFSLLSPWTPAPFPIVSYSPFPLFSSAFPSPLVSWKSSPFPGFLSPPLPWFPILSSLLVSYPLLILSYPFSSSLVSDPVMLDQNISLDSPASFIIPCCHFTFPLKPLSIPLARQTLQTIFT